MYQSKKYSSLLNPKNEYVIFLINFIFIFIFINISPSIYGDSIEDFDSQNYITFSQNRLSIYPFIVSLFGINNLKILIIFQTILFSLSLAYLCLKFTEKTNRKWGGFFQLSILINFVYLSYCGVVLTECLFFSSINLIVALLLDLEKNFYRNTLIISMLSGLLISLRPEGIVLALIFFIITFLSKNQKLNFFFLNLMILSIFPIFEKVIYFQKYDERKSVFDNVIIGKIYMLSSSKNFKFTDFPELDYSFLNDMQKSSSEIKFFVDSIKNPYLKSNLITDYEAISQYGLPKILGYDLEKFQNHVKNLNFKSYLRILKNYPLEYLRLTFHHYVSMSTPGGTIFLFKKVSNTLNVNIPLSDSFKTLSGNMNLEILNEKLVIITYLTLVFMCFYFFLTIFALVKVFEKNKNQIFYFLIIASQIHLFSVSFFNIGSIRYVMPVYPIITITSISFFIVIFSKRNFRENKK